MIGTYPGTGVSRPGVAQNTRHQIVSQVTLPLVIIFSKLRHGAMSVAEAQADYVHVPHTAALDFTRRLLEANGVSSQDAAVVAENLVSADLRGVDSHGINRLPSYLKRVRLHVLDPKARPTLDQVTPVVARMSRHACPRALLTARLTVALPIGSSRC